MNRKDEGVRTILPWVSSIWSIWPGRSDSRRRALWRSVEERLQDQFILSALGNVISALVDGKGKHIPYRDSEINKTAPRLPVGTRKHS